MLCQRLNHILPTPRLQKQWNQVRTYVQKRPVKKKISFLQKQAQLATDSNKHKWKPDTKFPLNDWNANYFMQQTNEIYFKNSETRNIFNAKSTSQVLGIIENCVTKDNLPNVYNCAIRKLIDLQNFEMCWKLFNQCKQNKDCNINIEIYNTMIFLCCQQRLPKSLSHGLNLRQQIHENNNLVPTEQTFTNLICLCTNYQALRRAENIWKQFINQISGHDTSNQDEGANKNENTNDDENSGNCDKNGEKNKKVFKVPTSDKINSETIVNAMINCYVKCGRIGRAMQLFNFLINSNELQPSDYTFAIVIAGWSDFVKQQNKFQRNKTLHYESINAENKYNISDKQDLQHKRKLQYIKTLKGIDSTFDIFLLSLQYNCQSNVKILQSYMDCYANIGDIVQCYRIFQYLYTKDGKYLTDVINQGFGMKYKLLSISPSKITDEQESKDDLSNEISDQRILDNDIDKLEILKRDILKSINEGNNVNLDSVAMNVDSACLNTLLKCVTNISIHFDALHYLDAKNDTTQIITCIEKNLKIIEQTNDGIDNLIAKMSENNIHDKLNVDSWNLVTFVLKLGKKCEIDANIITFGLLFHLCSMDKCVISINNEKLYPLVIEWIPNLEKSLNVYKSMRKAVDNEKIKLNSDLELSNLLRNGFAYFNKVDADMAKKRAFADWWLQQCDELGIRLSEYTLAEFKKENIPQPIKTSK